MKNVHSSIQPIKATQFRQKLFETLDICRDTRQPIWIERGNELYQLIPIRKRKAIGSQSPRPGVISDSDSLPEFSPSEWNPDDFS
jgi:hypothetical protein